MTLDYVTEHFCHHTSDLQVGLVCNMRVRLVGVSILPGTPQPASPRENQSHRDLYKL